MQRIRIFLMVSLLAITCGAYADDQDHKKHDHYATTFVPRSIADNLVMSNHFYCATPTTDACCTDRCGCVDISAGYAFQRSFHGKRIAKRLFGSDTLSFSGRDIKRGSNPSPTVQSDLFADYFGLSSASKSATISFDPHIQSHIVNINAHVGLLREFEGAYVHINIPLAHTKWELRTFDDCDKNGKKLTTVPFVAGYMDDMFTYQKTDDDTVVQILNTPAPLTTFADALNGIGFGKVKPWNYGKFFNKKTSISGIAGINFDLGYNFIDCSTYSIGAYAHIAAPGSDRKNIAEYVFQPVLGDAQWKFGAGLTGRAELYHTCDGEHLFTGMVQGYLAHPLTTTQKRLFDFKDKGHLSRYMLLKEFDQAGYATGNVISGVNFSTRNARVKIDLEGEFLAQLDYKNCSGFGASLGYNLYGKSHEKIKLLTDPQVNPALHYGFKGDSDVQMAIFQAKSGPFSLIYTSTPLFGIQYVTSTQSNATISNIAMYTFQGDGVVDNYFSASGGPDVLGNYYIGNGSLLNELETDRIAEHPYPLPGGPIIFDLAANSFFSASASSKDQPLAGFSVENFSLFYPLQTSFFFTPAPIYTTDEYIDSASAEAPYYITHKFFGGLDYAFKDCYAQPYIKIGGSVELAAHRDTQSLNQWGLYFIGGAHF